jgi:hypothetical protein
MAELTLALRVALGCLAFAALLFLPGFLFARRMVGRGHGARLAAMSVVISTLIISALVGALVAARAFDPRIVAAFALLLSALSLPAMTSWLWPRRRMAAVVAAGAVVLALPWLIAVSRPDFAPAYTLQWYYWQLGDAMTASHGVPAAVSEYGWDVRWLPDYVFFNGVSETFSVLLAPVGPAVAMQLFRVPVALAGFGSFYLVSRLWLSRRAALVAVAAVTASVLFINRFNTYKPESLGIVIALLAAWAIVSGLRQRRLSWIAAGGAALGVAVGIHAIAATVVGLLLVGACLSEVLFARTAWRQALGLAGAAAAIALIVVLVSGLLVQGRPIVAVDVLNPATGRAIDPTWTYLQYSTGHFDQAQPPPVWRALAGSVTEPWRGIRLRGLNVLWFAWLIGLGLLALAIIGGRRARRGLVAGMIGGLALGASIAFFAEAFSTYVPQHTGLGRFAQYVPAAAGLAVGFAVEGALLAWRTITGSRVSRAVSYGAVAAIIVLTILAVDRSYHTMAGIRAVGSGALEAVSAVAEPGDVLLSNALTTGQIEFFTPAEVPLEGRQPLIEEPALLDHANEVLLSAHEFFESDPGATILSELGVRWVLVFDNPQTIGASATLGGNVASVMADPRLLERWSAPGAALFEVARQ